MKRLGNNKLQYLYDLLLHQNVSVLFLNEHHCTRSSTVYKLLVAKLAHLPFRVKIFFTAHTICIYSIPAKVIPLDFGIKLFYKNISIIGLRFKVPNAGMINKLAQQINNHNSIILGDFNIPLHKDTNNRKILCNLCRALNFRIVTPANTSYTFFNKRTSSMIDYMLVHRSFRFKNFTALEGERSDHLIISLSLKLPSFKTSKFPLYNKKKISNTINSGSDTQLSAMLNKYPKPSAISNRKLRRLKRKAAGDPFVAAALKNIIKKTTRSIARKIRSKKSLFAINFKVNRKLVNSAYYKCFKPKYSDLVLAPPPSFDTILSLFHPEPRSIDLDSYSRYSIVTSNRLDPILTISNEEISNSIKSFPHSAAGPLSWPIKYIKDNIEIFTKCASRILSMASARPIQFNNSLTTLIPKKSPGSFRPIAVGNAIFRVITRKCSQILISRLQHLFPQQSGFLPGKSCHVNINILLNFFKSHPNAGYACFIEFKSAYNSVLRSAAFLFLRNNGVHEADISLLKNLLNNAHTKYKCGDDISPKVKIRRGLNQGCPLSPFLFNCAIQPILDHISNLPNINVAAYADDIVLFSTDLYVLNDAFTKLQNFANSIGLHLNIGIKKSALISNIPYWDAVIPDLEIAALPIVKKYKFLGIMISPINLTDSLNFTPPDSLFNILWKCRSFFDIRNVYNSYVLGFLNYPSIYFSYKHIKQLAKTIWKNLSSVIRFFFTSNHFYFYLPNDVLTCGLFPSIFCRPFEEHCARLKVQINSKWPLSVNFDTSIPVVPHPIPSNEIYQSLLDLKSSHSNSLKYINPDNLNIVNKLLSKVKNCILISPNYECFTIAYLFNRFTFHDLCDKYKYRYSAFCCKCPLNSSSEDHHFNFCPINSIARQTILNILNIPSDGINFRTILFTHSSLILNLSPQLFSKIIKLLFSLIFPRSIDYALEI